MFYFLHWKFRMLKQTKNKIKALAIDRAASVLVYVGLKSAVKTLEQTHGKKVNYAPHAWVAHTWRTSADILPHQSAQNTFKQVMSFAQRLKSKAWQLQSLWNFNVRKMSGKCQEKVRNFPHVWNWCKEKSVCRNSTHWKNVRNFSFDFSSSDECVEKCEEIHFSQFHTFKMWGNPFFTFSNVRKGFPHIGKCEEILSSHWKMWGNPFLTLENVKKGFFTLENVRNYSNLFWVIVRIFFFFLEGRW